MRALAYLLAVLSISLACGKHDFSSRTDRRAAQPGRNEPIDLSRPDPTKPNP